MLNLKNILVFFAIMSFLIVLTLGSVSAANLIVTENTTQNDINNWMKDNNTVKGDNLIFTSSKYDLNDTIVVSKSVNIKSNVKTSINFNKNKNMFNVTTSDKVCFSGLNLNHNGMGISKEVVRLIFSNNTKSIVNIMNVNFNLNNRYLAGIVIKNWKGNISGSIFKSIEKGNIGVGSANWTGNIYKTSISTPGGAGIVVLNWKGNISNSKIYFSGKKSFGIGAVNWTGNLYNSNILSVNKGFGVFIDKWNGKVSNTIINIKGSPSCGFLANKSSRGTIFNSKIYAKKGSAILITKNVKIIKIKALSASSIENILIIGPRVYPESSQSYINSKSLLYKIKVSNFGESKSKTSYLTFKYGKYKKEIKIKALKPGKSTIVKVLIPKSFKTYKKRVTITYYNGAGKKSTTKTWKIK